MKNRIISYILVLALVVSTILGTAIFVGAEGSDAEYKGTALNLAENITVKVQVATTKTVKSARITVDGAAAVTVPAEKIAKSGDDYLLEAEVAVKDFTKDVKFELIGEDGASFFEKVTSAKAYCDVYKEGEFSGLLAALEVYAAAAAAYFDGAAAVNVDADLSGVADAAASGEMPEGISHRSATLVLESETTVRHYFTLAEGKNIENYKFFLDTDGDGEYDAIEKLDVASKLTSEGTTVYYVDVDGITPNELDVVYTVGVYGVADGKTYTCSYGALTYAKSKVNSNSKLANLVKALYNYNAEAGKLKGTITFNANGGSAVEAQTYEYGVDFPVIATSSASLKAFLYWADENGNKVDTIPASSTGDITLTAVWKSCASYSWSTDCSDAKGIYNGYCPNHKDGDDEDAFCDNCGYCIAQCEAQSCSKCGKKTEAKLSYGMLDTKIWENQSYSLRKIKDGIAGAEIGFKQSLSKDTAYLGFGGTSYKNANANGANQIIYNFTLARADEDSPVLRLYGRVRASADKSNSGINIIEITDAGMFKIVGKDSNVYLTTDPHTYSIVVDVSDSVSRDGKTYFTASLYVDGVLAYTGQNNRDFTLDKYDSDNFLQFRVREGSGEGRIWFGDEISIKSVYTENVIRIAGEDKAIPYSYTPGTVTKLPTPTKDGFEFAGWFTDEALTQPIYEIPANSYGEVKIYAKWNPVILDQGFDTDYEGINKSTGASGKFEVADGNLLWAPTKNSSGTQPSMTTSIPGLADYDLTDSTVTYTFELAKANGYDVLPVNFRFLATQGDSGINEVRLITLTANGDVKAGQSNTVLANLNSEFVTIDVVVNFAEKTMEFYVNGLYATKHTNVNVADLSLYTNGGRNLNAYPTATAAAGETPDKAVLFGKIAINGGVNIADIDIDVTTVCTKHVDADDNGFCDNCPEVAFRDGAEALKSETVDEYKVSVEETIIITGTPTYADAPHIFDDDEEYSVSIIDVQNTTFDMVYFTVEGTRANNSDAWIGFAFLTEMPEAGKDLPFADGYNTIKFASYDKAVEIPADAKYLLICDKEPSGNKEVYYYPAEVTFKKETKISENLRDNTLATYTVTNEMIVPGYGVIRYYKPWYDHVFARDTRNSDSKRYAVAFLSIEGCVFEHIEFTAPSSDAKEYGWSFLTELPKAGEVVSYATGYDGFKWTTSYTTTTDIPEDAKYLVIYYQDSWDEKDHYHFDSITFINDGVCNHDALPTTVYATMFSSGMKAGHCDVCGKDVSIEIPANEVTIYSRDNTWSGSDASYYNTPYVYPLLKDGEHFYPTEEHEDGQSLFIEFSVLFNETHKLATKNGKAWIVPGMLSDEDFDTFFKPFYIHIDPNDTKYCLFTGGIELSATFDERYENDVTTYQTSGDVSNDVINNFYGWHRIGVEYWQHAYINDSGNVAYTMYSTLYIDGQPVVQQKKTGMTDHLLYEAKIVDGKLVYSDSSDRCTRITTAFIQHITPAEYGTMYTPVTDAYVSIGEDFILDVTPLTTPQPDTYEVAPGVVLDAPWCFEYSN